MPNLKVGFAYLVAGFGAVPLASALDNGLALKPPMGWNSYNHYSCFPNQTIMHSNAQALVDLGLDKLGYIYVTTDCGWGTQDRSADGKLQWDPILFPDGFPALGRFLHKRGLKFGVYSDSGIQMCSSGQNITGSLHYETVDAQTFANWGADMLKYDNCYSDKAAGYPDASYTPSKSPAPRFAKMSRALKTNGRKMLYSICEWGVNFPSNWAPPIGNTWRITNDIIPSWPTVYRQVNQFVPQASFAGPGRWLDLDMLEVGNNVFTNAEEQTHFTLWAMAKSPLVIGGALKDQQTSISKSSLAILSNIDVIAVNQDDLGTAANLTRRYTEEMYDVWSGSLSEDRTVAALVNWADTAQAIQFNFPDFGIQHAGSVKDIWNNKTVKNVATSYTVEVPSHGTLLLELSRTNAAGQYETNKFAKTKGASTEFSNIYGITNSASYRLTVVFTQASSEAQTFTVTSSALPSEAIKVDVPTKEQRVTTTIPLAASNANTLIIKGANKISHISIAAPAGTFYPATSFTPQGAATAVTCAPSTCAPVGAKIGYLSPSGSASISIPRSTSTASSRKIQGAAGKALDPSTRYVELTYTNNDIAFASAFTNGRNARNITITVNGNAPVRLEVPLSGRSSNQFSPGQGWYDSATLGLLVGGFETGAGNDSLVVGNVGGENGVVAYGADFVGLRVF